MVAPNSALPRKLVINFRKYVLNAQGVMLIMLAASFYTLLFGGLF